METQDALRQAVAWPGVRTACAVYSGTIVVELADGYEITVTPVRLRSGRMSWVVRVSDAAHLYPSEKCGAYSTLDAAMAKAFAVVMHD